MNTNPKISIIIPVYNVEAYLQRCMDSVFAQTFRDIEVIMIDDGSKDKSGKMCDRFSEEDSRVRVIHKQNGGLSAARNDGIAAAKAEYILFIDSDDWVEPTLCEQAYSAVEAYGADLVYFMHTRRFQNGKHEITATPFKDGVISKKDALYINNKIAVTAWSFLYHRRLLDQLPFPVGRLCEDMAVTHKYIHNASRIVLINAPLYNYTIGRKGSIWNTPSKQLLNDGYELGMQRIADLENWGFDASYQRMLLSLFFLANEGRKSERGRECDAYVRNHKETPDELNIMQKIMLGIYRFSPALFDFICVITRQRKKV